MTDKNLNINLLNTKEDVSSGMHVPSGDAQYVSPSATMEAENEDGYVEDVSIKKKALNMLDIPSAGVPENPGLSREQGADEETNLYGAKSDSFDSPPINDKYKSQNNNKNYGNNSNSVEESYFTYLYDLDHDSNIGILDDLKNTFYYSKEASKMSKNIDKRIVKALGLLKSAEAPVSHVPAWGDGDRAVFSINQIMDKQLETLERGTPSQQTANSYRKYLTLFTEPSKVDVSDLGKLQDYKNMSLKIVKDVLGLNPDDKVFVSRYAGEAGSGQMYGDDALKVIDSKLDQMTQASTQQSAAAPQAPMASTSVGTDEWSRHYPDASVREPLKAAWVAYPASKKVSESGLEYGNQQAPDSFWGFVQWYKHEKAANGGKDFSPAVAIHKLKAEAVQAPTQTAKLTDPNSVPESMKSYTEPKNLENIAPQSPGEQGPMMPQASATKIELNKLAKVLTNKKAKDAVMNLIKKSTINYFSVKFAIGWISDNRGEPENKKLLSSFVSALPEQSQSGGFNAWAANYCASKGLPLDSEIIYEVVEPTDPKGETPKASTISWSSFVVFLQNELDRLLIKNQQAELPKANIESGVHSAATHAQTTHSAQGWDDYIAKTPKGTEVQAAWMHFVEDKDSNKLGYTDDYASFVKWYKAKKVENNGQDFGPDQAIAFLTPQTAAATPAAATPAETSEAPAVDKDGKPEEAKSQVSGMEAVKAVTINTINSLYKMSGSDKNYFRMLDKKRVGSAQATKQRLDWLFRSAGFNYDKLADAVIKRMPGTAQITQADVMDNKWTGFVAMEFVDAIKSLVQEIRSKKQQKANAANTADDGKGGKSSRASLERMAKLIKLT